MRTRIVKPSSTKPPKRQVEGGVFLPRNKNGTNLSVTELERAVWFDIEKRKDDSEPALTGYLVDGEFTIVVHDSRLQLGADYSNLNFQPATNFYQQIIERCRLENRLLISYTMADFGFVVTSNPELNDVMSEVHQKAKFTSYFKYEHPDLYAEMQARQKKRHGNKRTRFITKKKKSGDFEVGLKDMLKLVAVGYPERSKVGIGGSANAIKDMRKRFEKSC